MQPWHVCRLKNMVKRQDNVNLKKKQLFFFKLFEILKCWTLQHFKTNWTGTRWHTATRSNCPAGRNRVSRKRMATCGVPISSATYRQPIRTIGCERRTYTEKRPTGSPYAWTTPYANARNIRVPYGHARRPFSLCMPSQTMSVDRHRTLTKPITSI